MQGLMGGGKDYMMDPPVGEEQGEGDRGDDGELEPGVEEV